MKAAVINNWGSPEVFEISEIEKPQITANQLLIKVYASSINPVDWKHRLGNHKYILGSKFPIVLGYDVCGEVIEAGTEITQFKLGDIVFGDLDNKYGGALAQYAVGTENCFALKPGNISNTQAASLPLVSLTALQALRDKANLQPGQTVLINGSSGGVGHIAIQIAKVYGAKVIAVASSRNKDFVSQLNPDILIDYNIEDVLKIKEQVDVFFDTIGNYSFLKTKHLLKENGVYINTLPRPKILAHKFVQAFTKGKKVKTLLRKHSSDDLEIIKQWVEQGKLMPRLDKQFKIEDIAEAHNYAEQGKTRGKNVIVIQ